MLLQLPSPRAPQPSLPGLGAPAAAWTQKEKGQRAPLQGGPPPASVLAFAAGAGRWRAGIRAPGEAPFIVGGQQRCCSSRSRRTATVLLQYLPNMRF